MRSFWRVFKTRISYVCRVTVFLLGLVFVKMGKGRDFTLEEKVKVITMHQDGASLRCIAKAVHRSVSGIKGIIDFFKEHGEVNFKRIIKNPTPPKISEKSRKYLVLLSKRDRRKTLPVLTEEINQVLDDSVSNTTVRKSLLRAGLYGRVACKNRYFEKLI